MSSPTWVLAWTHGALLATAEQSSRSAVPALATFGLDWLLNGTEEWKQTCSGSVRVREVQRLGHRQCRCRRKAGVDEVGDRRDRGGQMRAGHDSQGGIEQKRSGRSCWHADDRNRLSGCVRRCPLRKRRLASEPRGAGDLCLRERDRRGCRVAREQRVLGAQHALGHDAVHGTVRRDDESRRRDVRPRTRRRRSW